MDTLRDEFGNQMIEEKEGFDAVKNMVRTTIQEKLGLYNAERIFLVSNGAIKVKRDGQQCWDYDNSPDYEFHLLVTKIQNDMRGEDGMITERGRAFILATGAISESAIRAKTNVLRNQSWGWSTLSGVLGSMPIPGVSFQCDVAIIIANATSYFTVFGLSPNHYLGEGITVDKIQNLVRIMSTSTEVRAAAVVGMTIGLDMVEGVKFLPMVGSVVGSVVSFASTCTILHQVIDFCEIEALKVIQQN